MSMTFLRQAATYVLVVSCSLTVGNSSAQTASGTASATVVEPVSVNLVTIRSVMEREAVSAPLLRIESAPAAMADNPPGEPGSAAAVPGGEGADSGSSTGQSNTVNVTVNANGSLSVSTSGNGLSFSASKPDNGKVVVEYN